MQAIKLQSWDFHTHVWLKPVSLLCLFKFSFKFVNWIATRSPSFPKILLLSRITIVYLSFVSCYSVTDGCSEVNTWSDKKVRELIAVRVLHTSLLNTTVVAFKVLPLGSYAPMPAPSSPFKTNLELALWNSLQRCRCITPDVISVMKISSFQYFLYLREQKKKSLGLVSVNR